MKTLRILGAMALCVVMLPSLTSCGDDDDDKGGDGTGGVLEIEGERLSYMSDGYTSYNIEYDNKGRITTVATNYGDLVINYSKGTIALEGSDEDQDRYKVKFNDRGYITELVSSWSYVDTSDGDRYQIKGSGTVTFSYNGSGNLSTITSKMSETEKDLDTGESGKFTENYTTKLTWTGGNLVKAVCKGTETEGREKDTYSETFDIEYSTTDNLYRQNPVAISEIANDGTVWNVLAAAGLFGKGPKMLPRVVSEVDDDDYTYTKNVSYTLNSVGAISTEKVSYDTYTYRYDDVPRGRSVVTVESKPIDGARSFFVKGSRRK